MCTWNPHPCSHFGFQQNPRANRQEELRPTSPLSFGHALIGNVDFELPHGYRPDAYNFNTWYGLLLSYKRRFRLVFEILKHKNRSNVPYCDNKEGGLVRIFVDKIPFEYGQRILKTMRQRSYRDLYEFLGNFFAEVSRHNEDSRLAKSIRDHFGGTAYIASGQASSMPTPSGYQRRTTASVTATGTAMETVIEMESYICMQFNKQLPELLCGFLFQP